MTTKTSSNNQKTVFVGLSGGVDSAVSAYLLKQKGYRVVGAHMKNWSQDIGGFECPWREDYQSAKEVATFLGIEFVMFDFEEQYRQKVVDYMLDEFRIGRTPNPDIMCNQEIKFKLFLDRSLEAGADLIATGHYARIGEWGVGDREWEGKRQKTEGGSWESGDGSREGVSTLEKAKDEGKDQTYFLYRISQEALSKTLFPLGDYLKTEVREIARKAKLPNADRKESMGICFVGKVGIKDFLSHYIETESGPIVDDNGQELGQHGGAIFYTIGQRSGLGIGGGLPYYVTSKDMSSNTVYVTKDLASDLLWSDKIKLTSTHWINQPPESGKNYQIRTRHRAKLIDAKVAKLDQNSLVLKLKEPVKATTPGQSTVIYNQDTVLGGGIVC